MLNRHLTRKIFSLSLSLSIIHFAFQWLPYGIFVYSLSLTPAYISWISSLILKAKIYVRLQNAFKNKHTHTFNCHNRSSMHAKGNGYYFSVNPKTTTFIYPFLISLIIHINKLSLSSHPKIINSSPLIAALHYGIYFDHRSMNFQSAHTQKESRKEEREREGDKWSDYGEHRRRPAERQHSVKELLNLKLTIMLIERCRYCDQPSGMEF